MANLAAPSDAERMDRHYRFQRFIYDGTRTHYLIGRRHLIDSLQPRPGESVLEIGCGTAWNLVRVAKRYPEARIFGVDVSNAMLATARASLKRHGLMDRVELQQGDATTFDPAASFGVRHFDRVFFSYALSMIPLWKDALAHAATLVAPGGKLLIVDFGQCGGLPVVFKKGLFAFLDHYTVTPRASLPSEVLSVAAEHGMTARITNLHRGYTDYAELLRPD